MKSISLFLFFLFIFVSNVFAEQVTFTWDANTEPDLKGYKMYISDSVDGEFTFKATTDVNEITEDIEPNTYVAFTAYDKNLNESEKSEVWFYENEPPSAPVNIRIPIDIKIEINTP